MKKFSKVLALGLAAVLVFGMSVSAADSPSTTDQPQVTDTPADPTDTPADPTDTPVDPTDTPADPTNTPVVPTDTPADPTDAPVVPPADDNNTPSEGASNVGATTSSGVSLVVSSLSVTEFTAANSFVSTITSNTTVTSQILSTIGVSTTTTTVTSATAVKTFDLSAPAGWDGTSAVTVDFAVSSVSTTSTYVVLHYLNGINAAPEVLQASVTADGKIRTTFTSFSPVVIVEVGLEVTGDDDNNTNNTNTNTTTGSSSSDGAPTSPKTGETLPIAGLIAVICMAGAALCAAKARYNK